MRSAGSAAQLWPRKARWPRSGFRPAKCAASARPAWPPSAVSNLDHENQKIGKAGRNRHLGRRPSVRGVVMNPNDHPHGGGEGKSPIGMPPKTPWGKPAMGLRTRKHQASDRLIVRRRYGRG